MTDRGILHFSKLRLTGFKSFVDPTHLIIGDGLTGVVGPNGCGKSNLLEALRWVMGENRPTAMRGGGMEDVIFAGAATRGARTFAEVTIHIDNTDRLAPAGFNDADQIEIVRRITRDMGSAYRVNGRDVRARDVQMLFADASTGAHSPALVRQGQISELISARPRARRRVLEEAAGISGLYQRRHEAELKLKGAEGNLSRVGDTVDQLATQLATLARQTRQAARYRTIAADLRRAEGMLLYLRWHETDVAQAAARSDLRDRISAAASAEVAARDRTRARAEAEQALPALREEETIAAAVLQRLGVQQASIADQEKAALARIETLEARIAQLARDIRREADLNRDAGDTIDRLEAEQAALKNAAEGHDGKLSAAAEAAREAGEMLENREADLSAQTEDLAQLSARHQSARRLVSDSRKALERSTAEAANARTALGECREGMERTEADFVAAEHAAARSRTMAGAAEEALIAAEKARADAQTREAKARAERSSAEGEQSMLSAEVSALTRLLQRDTSEGDHIMDRLQVQQGYEAALGAALADDLHAPHAQEDSASGWGELPLYERPQALPGGAQPLADHVSVPDVLARRMSQIGLIDPADGPRLQPQLMPGQRLVSLEGDLWRWDGYRARAGDAPSATALRLRQINRLEDSSQSLTRATAGTEAARAAHESLKRHLAERTEADNAARTARRAADTALGEASRALSRAEAARTLAASRLESLSQRATRHDEEAAEARQGLEVAEKQVADLGDLDAVRARVSDIRTTVEAARITMLSRRAAHDELGREGDARVRRQQEVVKELGNWRRRLETAEKQRGELAERERTSEVELTRARAAPALLAQQREVLSGKMGDAAGRQTAARAALAAGEAALRQTT